MPYNGAMSHPQIIIPFSLPPAEHGKDLVRLLASECGPNGLAMLLSRARRSSREHCDDFALALPHEAWLSKRHNPLRTLISQLKLTLPDGYWFIVNPVNLHIASTHLVLTDNRGLDLTEAEARALFDRARDLCSEVNVQLIYGDADHWLLGADAWSELVTATPDAACGHNIEIWSPKGPEALAWRKLQNEIQMDWFIHPVQEQRQMRAAKVINGLWLWGGTRIQSDQAPTDAGAVSFNPDIAEFLADAKPAVLDQLIAPALAGDWSAWAASMQVLEQNWLIPLCDALRSGTPKQIELVLSNSNTLLSLQISSGSLRRFWRRPSFNALL